MQKIFWVITFILVCTGCAGRLKTTADFDPSRSPATYHAYQTYAWIPDSRARTGDPRIDNAFIDDVLHRAIDESLSAKGYRKAPEATADLLVAYHTVTELDGTYTQVYSYYGFGFTPGYGRGRGGRDEWSGMSPAYTQAYTQVFEKGTLLIDIVDNQKKDLIWRGIAQATVDADADPMKREKRITSAVRNVMNLFPPEPGGS